MLLGWVGLLAWGQDASEEIIVWGDRFARWEHRWYVETEVRYPRSTSLPSWRGKEVRVSSVQVRAVLSCDKDFRLGPHQWEVSCDLEDVGLLAMVSPRADTDRDTQLLQELDATLTGATVQLQANKRGHVTDVDLEGSGIAHNLDARLRQEALRQLMLRVMLPFHLRLPEAVYDGVQWQEFDSRLLSMPTVSNGGSSGVKLVTSRRTQERSGTSSVGGTIMSHYLDRVGEHFVVQSIGKAVLFPSAEAEALDGGGGALSMPLDAFALDMHGVALFEPETGIMSERVWAIGGGPTASSSSALVGGSYLHTGSLRMLGERDRPDTGDTAAITSEAWRPLQP